MPNRYVLVPTRDSADDLVARLLSRRATYERNVSLPPWNSGPGGVYTCNNARLLDEKWTAVEARAFAVAWELDLHEVNISDDDLQAISRGAIE